MTTEDTALGGVEGTEPPRAERPVLDVRGLSITYRGVAAARGVDLTIAPGEIVGLIGESGSGKSSVAMSCLGMLPRAATVSAERLDVCGTDLRAPTQRELAMVRGGKAGMVFQDAMGSLDPTMRIGRQLAEVIRRHQHVTGDEVDARVVELLSSVGIPDPARRARQYSHELSGGLRQRCAIALGLAGRPQLLIADEPTTALDVTVQAGVLRLFRQIADELRVGVLLISHDLGVIAQTADRIVVMLDGEVVESGTVADVLQRPQHSYTRSLLAAVPTLTGPPVADDVDAAPPESQAEQQVEAPTVVMSARQVGRTYGRKHRSIVALHPTDLDVVQGEVLGIVGESGSGKSTLAKLLVHLEVPTSGQITFQGTELSQLGRAARRSFRRAIQMVFQHPAGSLNPRLRIKTSTREPLVAIGTATRSADVRALEALVEVGLDRGHAHRLPDQLSGGQKQRVAIARAMVAEPSVIVLDEPTSALDVSVQAQVLELLADVHARRPELTFVFISHNLAVVRGISDRVVVMHAGRIVELAAASELFDSPRHWYTAELIAAVPSVEPPDRNAPTAADVASPAGPAAASTSGAASASATATTACAYAARCPRAETICHTDVPALIEIAPGHLAACHHPRRPDQPHPT